MNKNKLRIIVYGSILSFLVFLGIWFFITFKDKAQAGAHNNNTNGLWLRRHWIHGGADLNPENLVESCNYLGISQIYPFLGPMNPKGIPGWRNNGKIEVVNYDNAKKFFTQVHKYNPKIQIYPWTGGVLAKDAHLQDQELRAKYVAQLQILVDVGADGVHINIEPLPSYEPGYLDLLKEVKAGIGNKTLSIAAYPPETPLHPFKDVHWSLDFIREVCLVADDLVFMAYDTALIHGVVYEGLVAKWTRDLAKTLPPPEEGGCTWSMGMPAYEDDFPWHDPQAETLEHGLNGLLRGLDGINPSNFTGAAVYASWTTDEQEWSVWNKIWRGIDKKGIVTPDFGTLE